MNPFAYGFMINAYLSALCVGLTAGTAGYVLVLRGQSFAGHALGHVGFAGATLALLLGAPPIAGLMGITVLGGMAMGGMGEGLAERDVGIGMILALSLGSGLLFLNFFNGSAAIATSLLFGNVFGVDRLTLLALAIGCAASLGLLAALGRRLLFASLQPELAEPAGINPRLMSVLFMGVIGLVVAVATQVVGVLLVFALLVGPAASAQRLTPRLHAGLLLSAGLAVAEAIGGVTLAFYTDWPASFWITALAASVYGIAVALRRN